MKLKATLTALLALVMALPVAATLYPNDVTVANSGDHGPNLLIVLRMGWMKGYSDGTFKPSRDITAEEMAIALNRAFPDGMTRIQFASFLRGGYERAILGHGRSGAFLGLPETITSFATTTIVPVTQPGSSPTAATQPPVSTTTTTTAPPFDYETGFRALSDRTRTARSALATATSAYLPTAARHEFSTLVTQRHLHSAIAEIRSAISYGETLLADTRTHGTGQEAAAVERAIALLEQVDERAQAWLAAQTGEPRLAPWGFDPVEFSYTETQWDAFREVTEEPDIEDWITYPKAVEITLSAPWRAHLYNTNEQRAALAKYGFYWSAQALEALYEARVEIGDDHQHSGLVENGIQNVAQTKNDLVKLLRSYQTYPFS